MRSVKRSDRTVNILMAPIKSVKGLSDQELFCFGFKWLWIEYLEQVAKYLIQQ